MPFRGKKLWISFTKILNKYLVAALSAFMIALILSGIDFTDTKQYFFIKVGPMFPNGIFYQVRILIETKNETKQVCQFHNFS